MERTYLNVSVSREELESALRLRVEAGSTDYRRAAADYGRLLQADTDVLIPDLEGTIAVAREDASTKVSRYAKLLRIFTDLTVNNKVTEETYIAAFGDDRDWSVQPNISIVDDDESVRAATKALLRSAGYRVEAFASANAFLQSGALLFSACLVLDLRMPDIDGLELQRRLNTADSTVPIIFISAHDDPPNQRKAIEAGAFNFFHKPFKGAALLTAIESVLLRGKPEGLTAAIVETLRTAIGASPA